LTWILNECILLHINEFWLSKCIHHVMGWSLVQRSPTMCLYVCDQETPKREAKGPSWTISACEWMNE
jgi:hypothetical protein